MRIADALSQRSSGQEFLLAHILKCQTIDLYKDPQKIITPAQYARFQKLLKKYSKGYPTAYLTGHKEFMSLDFVVTPAVLIPRPETEVLVEQAIKLLLSLRCPDVPRNISGRSIRVRRGRSNLVIFDLGTGSGNIAISIAKQCRIKNLRIFASDISRKALNVARLNAQLHKIPQTLLRWRQERQKQSSSISFCYGNLFKPFKGIKADMIVSNPPYVDRAEKSRWQVGLRYEPPKALWAGKKGLAYIEKIIKQAPDYLKPGGWLLLEIGQGQAKEAFRTIKATCAFRDIRILKDYSNIQRVLAAAKR